MIKNLRFYSLALYLLFSSTSCSTEKPKSPEELRAALRTEELLNPTIYLQDSTVKMAPQQKMVRKAGLFRSAKYENDGAIIEGTIINKATLATYKDVVVNVYYYSKTKTVIKEEQFVLYEYVKPYSSTKFSLKVHPPEETATFGLVITDARADFDLH